MRKFRVFREVIVILEREIEAESFNDARTKMQTSTITPDDIAKGEVADSKITGAEDTSNGELHYFDD